MIKVDFDAEHKDLQVTKRLVSLREQNRITVGKVYCGSCTDGVGPALAHDLLLVALHRSSS